MADSVREDVVKSFDNHNTQYNGYGHNAEIRSKPDRQAAAVRECVIRHRKAIE